MGAVECIKKSCLDYFSSSTFLLHSSSRQSQIFQSFIEARLHHSFRLFHKTPRSFASRNQTPIFLSSQVSTRSSLKSSFRIERKSVKMVKISPLIASVLIGLVAAAPQAASGTESFSLPAPTGTGMPLPSGTGGFGGFGGQGGHPSGTGHFGPAPTGGKFYTFCAFIHRIVTLTFLSSLRRQG